MSWISKHGIEHQVAEHIHGDGQVLIEHLHAEADALLGGEGIHVAADGIDLAGDVFRGAMLGSLEDHVFDEMRDAIPLRVLVARSGLHPDANGDRTNVLHLLGNHGQPVGQDFALNVAYFFNHGLFELQQTGPCTIVTQPNRARRKDHYSFYNH